MSVPTKQKVFDSDGQCGIIVTINKGGGEMKGLVTLCIVLAAISFVAAIVSRVTLVPVGPMNIEASALLAFTNTCLLVALLLKK